MNRVRVDKWLWAARFFKTRSLAKHAIESGKVQINGQRAKASRELEIGMTLQVRQGWDEKEVEVIALSDKRGPASEAAALYTETPESIERRKTEAEARRLHSESMPPRTEGWPSGRQRRHIHRFKRLTDGLDRD